jgi:predicted dehydrogenase
MTKTNKGMQRREFLKTAGAATGMALAAPYVIPSGVLAAPGRAGANDRLTFGVVGVGGMGGYHLDDLVRRARRGELNVAAVCDVDEGRLANASKRAGPKAAVYRDYRFLIDRKDLDAVVFGTPDHWHGVQTVHAAERGKHVYVEKPACCTIEEGKAMVAAANQNKVSVQVGSQGRSEPDCHAACTYLRNGMLGKVHKVTCWHYANPVGGDSPDRPCPPELDWDLWLGPMRFRPYNSAYCHGTFRWFLESGGGQIRDRGAHVMSCALYLMGADHTGPVSIEAKGTAPTHGLWDCPVDMEVTYTFKDPDWVLTWSQPGVVPPKEAGVGHNDYGAVYHGEKDNLILFGGDGGTWTQRKAREFKVPAGGVEVYKSPGHKEDWFQGIKTGKKTIMNIEAAVATANLCILGNIAYILGRKIQWDPVKQEIVGDELARRMMSRPQRFPYHL